MNQQNCKKSSRLRIRNDIIFISAVIILISVTGAVCFLFRSEGNTVTVTVDGAVYGIYSIEEPLAVDILTGEQGENLNRLVISGGKATVELANCPDGICAAHRPISYEGESIVCLPHKVVITVHNTEDETGPDIIA